MKHRKTSILGAGCLELEMSLSVLETCCKAEPGQMLYLIGRAEKQGKRQAKSFKIKTERKQESVCLKILGNILGSASSKCLADKWVLVVSEVSRKMKSNTDNTSILSTHDGVDCSPEHDDNSVMPMEMEQTDKCTNKNVNGDSKQKNASDIYIAEEEKNADLCGTSSGECVNGDIGLCTENTEELDVKCGILLDSQENAKEQQVCCRFCGKSFVTNPNRPLMALQQHETKFCKRNPWSMTTLEPKPVVSLKYPYSCQYCPHAFTSESRCKKHEASCARRPDYMAKFDRKALMICDICNHMCANELGLAYHKTKTHGCPSSAKPRRRRKATPCACRFCGKMVTSHSTRFHHEHFKCEKNPNVEQGVRCKFCAQMCTKDKLQVHIEKHHSQMEQHMCEVCGKVFDGKHKLYQHRLTHTEIQTPRHKCPHCDKVYLLKTRLKIHMSKHIEERTVQCTVCGKFFKNKHQENRHRLTVHENRYRFRCEKCGHGMAKKVYLESHKCGRVRRPQDTERKINNKPSKQDFDIVMVCPLVENEHSQVAVNTLPTYDYYQEQTGFIPQRFEQQEQVISQDGIILEYFTS